MTVKALVVQRGMLTHESVQQLANMGIEVVWAYDVDGIKSVGDVPLRDYFAAAALQTMQIVSSWSDNPKYWEGVARSAYVCADAMLAEREKK